MNAFARDAHPEAGNEAGVLVLAAAPLLAGATGLLSGLGLSLIYLVLTGVSVLSVCMCRSIVPARVQIPLLLLMTATWTGVAEMCVGAWLFELHARAGIYLAVLCVNAQLALQLEERALSGHAGQALRAALGAAAGTAGLVCAVALLRELIATGTVLSEGPAFGLISPIRLLPGGVSVFSGGAGTLLLLGLAVAAVNAARHYRMPAREPSV